VVFDVQQDTFFVDPTYQNTGDSLLVLNPALEAAGPGDVVYLLNGVHTVPGPVSGVFAVAGQDDISLVGQDPQQAIIDAAGLSVGLTVRGDQVRLEDFSVRGPAFAGVWANGADQLTARGLTLSAVDSAGMVLDGASRFLVENTTFQNLPTTGLLLGDSVNVGSGSPAILRNLTFRNINQNKFENVALGVTTADELAFNGGDVENLRLEGTFTVDSVANFLVVQDDPGRSVEIELGASFAANYNDLEYTALTLQNDGNQTFRQGGSPLSRQAFAQALGANYGFSRLALNTEPNFESYTLDTT
jgi:hypothetical protein